MTMDDSEVTRKAIGIAFSAWSHLHTVASEEANNDFDVLEAYVQSCPFVTSKSLAMVAARKVIKIQKANQPQQRSRSRNTPPKAATTNTTPAEATRVAMRIAISAWSQLLVQTETMDDYQLLRLYIQQCPYSTTTTKVAVLEGIEHASLQTPQHAPPALGDAGEESESEESYSEKEKNSTEAARQQQHQLSAAAIPGASSSTTSNNKSNHLKQQRQEKSILRPLLFLLRSLLLDLPMAILFASYLALLWVHRVDERYLQPAMEAAVWSEDRAEREITYYNRECDVRDMSTHSSDDLWIPTDASTQQAYDHHLRHGFSIFQSILTTEVMDDLRTYVISRNRQLSADESIFVIENDNRFSFGLGTEEPAVARAIKQLSTHPRLAPALEKVMGKNPALIEMTAITSSYGAVDQWWHDDVIASASAMKYGRTFGPSYSIFIQLQNTTAEMGATAVCPGSHKCASGSMEQYCDTDGFQAVDTSTGYWKAGDALLMNMNSYHRGTAHIDPNGPDRVMLILTFVPKPEEKAESRQLSQGITFSLRWDMWGHTLYDLAQANTRMTQPWATLRALGLYKPKDAFWGIDYVSSATMRMANEDNGFREDELEDFLKRGGFHWLPQFLNGQVTTEEGGWHEFLLDTLERCMEFALYVNGLVAGFYILALLATSLVAPNKFGARGFGTSIVRSIIVYGVAFAAWKLANNHVDNSQWAKDIVAERKYAGAFTGETTHSKNYEHLPSTLPHQKDVLIETRYGSRQLDMYNDWVRDHPGSQLFHTLVRKYASAYSASQSDLFQNATAEYVVGAVGESQGRFLLQNGNVWRWLSREDAIDFTKAELVVEVNPILNHMRQEIRFLESDYKYGVHRGTAIAHRSLDALKHLKHKLLRDTPAGKAIFTSVEDSSDDKVVAWNKTTKSAFFQLRSRLVVSDSARPLLVVMGRRSIVNLTDAPTEPRFAQWLKSGDLVEGTEVLENGEAHWYKGTLHKVTASGAYYIAYADDSYSIIDRLLVRLYKPYFVGEQLEILLDDEMVDTGTITVDHGDGSYDIFIDEEEELVQGVPSGEMRRLREGFIMEEEEEMRNNYVPN